MVLINKAEFFAQLIKGEASQEMRIASVQRSHRFPLHIFTQIENLARIGEMPVSAVINQLLECGLEAIEKELPPSIVRETKIISEKQLKEPTVTEATKIGKKKTKVLPDN